MSDATPAPDSYIARIDGRGTIPDEIRERAYELWATTHKQNYNAVAETIGIKAATLRAWGRRHNWQARALDERLDIEPAHLRNAIGATIATAALECSRWLLGVAAGDIEPSRARQQLCISVMHMAGYAPSHYKAGGFTPAPTTDELADIDIDAATPDQLREIERKYLATGKG